MRRATRWAVVGFLGLLAFAVIFTCAVGLTDDGQSSQDDLSNQVVRSVRNADGSSGWEVVTQPVSQQSLAPASRGSGQSALDHCISAWNVIMARAVKHERDYLKDGYPYEEAGEMALARAMGQYSRAVGVSEDILSQCVDLLNDHGITLDDLAPSP